MGRRGRWRAACLFSPSVAHRHCTPVARLWHLSSPIPRACPQPEKGGDATGTQVGRQAGKRVQSRLQVPPNQHTILTSAALPVPPLGPLIRGSPLGHGELSARIRSSRRGGFQGIARRHGRRSFRPSWTGTARGHAGLYTQPARYRPPFMEPDRGGGRPGLSPGHGHWHFPNGTSACGHRTRRALV